MYNGIMRNFFFYLLLFSGTLLGCQSAEQENNRQFFGNLYVRYLEDGQEIKSEVTLFTGDSMAVAKAFEPEGGIQFLGSAMQSRNFNEQLTRYQFENRIPAPASYRFKFQDPEGNEVRVETPVHKIDFFSLTDPLSRSTGGTISLTPEQLGENQQILILLSNEEGLARTLELTGPAKISELSFPEKQLEELSPGKWEYYIVKKSYSRPQEGLQLLTEYYTKTQTLEIVD